MPATKTKPRTVNRKPKPAQKATEVRSHITLVLDRSGSMQKIRSDVIGAVNAFVTEQQKVPGECSFRLVQFDDEAPFETIYDGPLADAKPLTETVYVPRGNTPLLDAVGKGIAALESDFGKMPESRRPNKVVFVVQTDGLENASREWTKERVAEAVKKHTDADKWQFVFFGANMDAIAEGGKMGYSHTTAMDFAATGKGVKNSMRATSSNIAQCRVTLDSAMPAYSAEQRLSAKAE